VKENKVIKNKRLYTKGVVVPCGHYATNYEDFGTVEV
jgi:hypothetical protein